MLPYDHIIDLADRRWTFRLLDRLTAPDVPDDELDQLFEALTVVSDHRSFASLEAILCDLGKPTRLREAAGAVLRGLHFVALDPPSDKLRRWWLEGDSVLRRQALLFMGGICCPDVILQVASDPKHALQADALGRMDWRFDQPEHEVVKIAALSHPDAGVRSTAAWVLLWDEPVTAEAPLHQAARDPMPEVAAEAANTLEYYPTLRTIRILHDLLAHASDKVRDEAKDSFDSIRGYLLIRLCSPNRRVAVRIRRWLQPVWGLLAFTEEELLPDEEEETTGRTNPVKDFMLLQGLLSLLNDPDSSPQVLGERLRSNDWQAYGEGDRRLLRPILLSHPDQLVREQAATVFEEWRDSAGLVELVRDDDFLVRKAATYHISLLPPTSGMADLAWGFLQRPDVFGTHAMETLAAFVRHADPAIAVPRLEAMAANPERREELRVAAVDHLRRLGAAIEVSRLGSLLRQPPEITWALHISILKAFAGFKLPRPDVRDLEAVDNMYVQEVLAWYDSQ